MRFRRTVLTATSVLHRGEWDAPDVRRLKLRTLTHRFVHCALEDQLGLITRPAVTCVWCTGSDWDAHGVRTDHVVPAGSPGARIVIVTLTAKARPLRAQNSGDPVFSNYAKATVAFLGGVFEVINVAALPESWQPWIAPIVAIVTVLGVRQVPNAPAPAGPAAGQSEF
jgi:hypothetical protein